MTITSHKEQLLTRFQEFVIAQQELTTVQQTMNQKRSEMHCIIAALPDEETSDGEKPEVTDTSNAAYENAPTIARHQDAGSCENQTYGRLDHNSRDPRNRPFLIVQPQSDVFESEPLSSQQAPPQLAVRPKTKRLSPSEKKAKIQEALVFCMENPHLTLMQVAIQHGLEPKALSRSYAGKLKKAMFPNRETRAKPAKAVADDFLYNEKR